MMTPKVLFHFSGIRTFKKFYKDYVCNHLHELFPELARRGECSLASSCIWSLARIVEALDFMLTPANVGDREPLKMKGYIEKLFGKLFGGKGCISKELFQTLFLGGIHLVTKLKKGMKTKLATPLSDALLQCKRVICVTIIVQVNPDHSGQLEYSRHHNPRNFLTNLFSALMLTTLPRRSQSEIYGSQKPATAVIFNNAYRELTSNKDNHQDPVLYFEVRLNLLQCAGLTDFIFCIYPSQNLL